MYLLLMHDTKRLLRVIIRLKFHQRNLKKHAELRVFVKSPRLSLLGDSQLVKVAEQPSKTQRCRDV